MQLQGSILRNVVNSHGKCPWDLIDIMVSLFFMLLPELVESNTSASMFLLLGAFAITAVTLA